ncbi:MAG: hypothetical protein ACLR7U_12690 [Ruthenibacterium lactatiformans]
METGAEEPFAAACRQRKCQARRQKSLVLFSYVLSFSFAFFPHAAGPPAMRHVRRRASRRRQQGRASAKAALHGLSMQQNVKKRKLCCFLQRFDIIIVIVKSQQNHLF